MAEVAFEKFMLALESTRGTAVTPPTHLIHIPGTLTPWDTKHRPKEARGTLVENYRSYVTRKGTSFDAEGDLDVNIAPVLFNMGVKGGVTSPSTPGGATNTRLWAFVPGISADNLKSGTLSWGDPNIQSFQADYAMLDEIKLTNDASSEDGVLRCALSGMAGAASKISAPVDPGSIAGDVPIGQLMQLWIDTSSAIGSTEVTGRLISAEHTIPTGVTYKYWAGGTSSTLDYSNTGRDPFTAITTLILELINATQYDLWAAASTLKVRVCHNGALIEGSFYNYVEIDTYGEAELDSWGVAFGSNRTISLTVKSTYDSTLGASFRVAVQNARTGL